MPIHVCYAIPLNGYELLTGLGVYWSQTYADIKGGAGATLKSFGLSVHEGIRWRKHFLLMAEIRPVMSTSGGDYNQYIGYGVYSVQHDWSVQLGYEFGNRGRRK